MKFPIWGLIPPKLHDTLSTFYQISLYKLIISHIVVYQDVLDIKVMYLYFYQVDHPKILPHILEAFYQFNPITY